MSKGSVLKGGIVLAAIGLVSATALLGLVKPNLYREYVMGQPIDKNNEVQIDNRVAISLLKSRFGQNLNVVQVTPLDKTDLFLIRLGDGSLLYTDSKMSVLIAESNGKQPQVYRANAEDGVLINETEHVNRAFIKNNIAHISETIDFISPTEKYVIKVFFDPVCHFCQKMVTDIQTYLDLGISVKFIPFPIFGEASKTTLARLFALPKEERKEALISTESFFANNKGRAIDLHKMGLDKNENEAKDVVEKSLLLGRQMGVMGTPGIVLENGELLRGAVSAQQLLKYIEQK